MSALIKSGAADVTRALPLGAARAVAEKPKAKPDPRDTEIVRLRGEIARLGELLAQGDEREALAREQGHAAGLADAEADEAARAKALRDGLAQAASDFEARLAVLDGLAPALARAALEKLFAPATAWTAMVEPMLARQLQVLKRSSVVTLAVSADDFEANHADGLCGGQHRVARDPDLRSGAARIECRLGQIDLDARDQWAGLAALLDGMAA